MPSVTSWSRIEPAPPGNDVAAGLAARTADALWLLARQWQVGEFQAEDGGTPIVARWRGHAIGPTRCVFGTIPPDTRIEAPHFDAAGVPLEVIVERQPCRLDAPAGVAGLRLGVDAGRHFLRLLAAQSAAQDYGPAFRAAFAVAPLAAADAVGLDAATLAYHRLVAGRALDGRRLRAALAGLRPNALPNVGTPIAAGDAAEVRAACAAWVAWVDELFSQPGAGEQAWQRDRMEYAVTFSTRTSPDQFDEWTLDASQYGGGALEWYSFDRRGDVNVGTTAAESDAGAVVVSSSLPAPVTLRGMPAPRFWEMEDALLDLGALQPGGTDLTQLLMIDTVTGYGNDWYVVGLDLPTGSLVTTRSLVVVDTFGVETLLRPNGDINTVANRGWNMFQLAMPFDVGAPGAPMTNAFLLAGTIATPLEGPPIEEVLFLRDEQANVAWAIERRLTNPLGQAVDAAGDAIDIGAEPAPTTPRENAQYRLASAVPPHWIPLLPVRPDPDSAEIRLSRAAVLDVDGGRRTLTSIAVLLGDPDEPLLIPEEEVPREGAVVRRSFQAARGTDGRLHVWLTHRRSVGRGEGSSGLRFDTLLD